MSHQPPQGVGGFKKVDLHVHTPQSDCYDHEIRFTTTPEQIVEAALGAGLDAMAITDHNTFRGIDGIREAGKKRGLFVFPGVELTARGGHVLAIFDLDAPLEELEGLLQEVGISVEAQGDGVARTVDGIEDVLRKIEGRGGIAIAAHVDREPHGFLQENDDLELKRRILANHHLCALEITVPRDKVLWNQGQMRGFPKRQACIQGSDAHAPEEIGRRPIYMRMEPVSLEAMRLALHEYEARIRFPFELQEEDP